MEALAGVGFPAGIPFPKKLRAFLNRFASFLSV